MVLLALSLVACSSQRRTLLGMFGAGEEDIILPGEREEVLKSGPGLEPDPEIAAAPFVMPAAHTNASWSQPGGLPDNAPQHLALSADLQQVWQADAGSGSSSQGRLAASPIMVGGRVFVLDTQATLRAFDASSGNRLWVKGLAPEKEEAEEGFGGGIASDGTLVFATTAFGNVIAVDAGTGQTLWGKKLEVPIRTAPTVADGRVYFTTVSNEVYCLSADEGTILWRFQGTGETAALIASTSPAVADGIVVIPYTSGEIMAFSVADGLPLWGDSLSRTGVISSLSLLNDIAGRPVIDNGQVFAIAHAGRLVAIDLRSGQRLWARNISGTQTPWVAGDYVFVISEDGTFSALSRKDGRVRWTTTLPAGHIWSGPVLAGGRLIAVSSKGVIANISPENGSILSQVDIGRPMYIAPVIAGNTAYILTDDATLIAMR